jgi:hypothetical protein
MFFQIIIIISYSQKKFKYLLQQIFYLFFPSIQFKLHAMSFNIFIWMELDFHKIKSFFYPSIVSCMSSRAEPKGIIIAS